MVLGRTGGDEFAFAIPHQAPAESAHVLVEQIFETLRDPFLVGEREAIQLSTSIGMAFYPADAADAGSLMGRADAALYRAKEAGRNTWRSSG
jgi:diguanylate cyclase (GGDEF)-like protein